MNDELLKNKLFLELLLPYLDIISDRKGIDRVMEIAKKYVRVVRKVEDFDNIELDRLEDKLLEMTDSISELNDEITDLLIGEGAATQEDIDQLLSEVG